MSIERLARVMARVRMMKPGKTRVHRDVLQKAIMWECGTDPSTYRKNRKALVKLGWIRTRKTYFDLTDKDLEEAGWN